MPIRNPRDWVEPNTCISENLDLDAQDRLRLRSWSVPRLVVDVIAHSGADGKLFPAVALPGKLLIEQRTSWTNETPLDQMVLIRVTRASKAILVSNPNAVQFRDRWSWAVDRTPSVPDVTGIYNGQCGAAADLGTNTVAEPNPGRLWLWTGAHSSDEWVGPIGPNETLNLWYRGYVWTPPPWSDNANKNKSQHEASAKFTRIQMMAFPQQGRLVTG